MTSIEQTLDALWNYNDPEASEKQFRELLTHEPKHQTEILTQIARTLGLQRKFTEAHDILDELALLPNDQRIDVRYLLERGRVYNSSKQSDKAKPLFLEAYTLAKSIGADFYTIDAAHMMAIVEIPDKQLLWHEVCLELCEETTNERAKKWMGSVSNNLGWTYHDMGRFEDALATFQKALVWQEANGKPETIRIAKWSMARTLRSLEQFQAALDIQQRLLSEEEKDGYIYEEIGECLLALGQINNAKHYLARAYELLSQDSWLANNEKERLQRLKDLGVL
jgi:tetratricopeptide (TPR) repeat protein